MDGGLYLEQIIRGDRVDGVYFVWWSRSGRMNVKVRGD